MIMIRYHVGVDAMKQATKPFQELHKFQQELASNMYCKMTKVPTP